MTRRVCLQITGVSILRAGETMEQALMAVCKDIRLGKILIQTNHDTGEPEVRGDGSQLFLLNLLRCVLKSSAGSNVLKRTWEN